MSDGSSDEHTDDYDHGKNSKESNKITNMAKKVTTKLVDKTLANATLFHHNSTNTENGHSNGNGFTDPLNIEFLPLARAHWLLINQQDNGIQMKICKNMILNVLEKYSHMRPVWQFSKNIDFDDDNWREILLQDNQFR